jgi:hypothetical protein
MSARLFAALALFLAIPGLALADSVGSAGAIKSLELNTVHADAYLLNQAASRSSRARPRTNIAGAGPPERAVASLCYGQVP